MSRAGRARIAFIGLGIMGLPMASNLLNCGFDVVGVNRSEGRSRIFADRGGKTAASVAEAVSGADAAITMLPDAPDVEAVALGESGVLANAASGMLYADMSTVGPGLARTLAAAGSEKGVLVLDAPVSGGEAGAVDASLSIMAGGEPEAFERARPIFEAMGSTVTHVGPAGAGQTVKAANQVLAAGIIELVSEAIVFLEAQGVDAETGLAAISKGLAANAILDRKGAAMLARDFTPGFRAELHHKDLGIAMAAAREAHATMPLGALAAQLMGALVAKGRGKSDHGALLGLVEELSGRA